MSDFQMPTAEELDALEQAIFDIPDDGMQPYHSATITVNAKDMLHLLRALRVYERALEIMLRNRFREFFGHEQPDDAEAIKRAVHGLAQQAIAELQKEGGL